MAKPTKGSTKKSGSKSPPPPKPRPMVAKINALGGMRYPPKGGAKRIDPV